MAFCGNCGKELKDGEVCSCQTAQAVDTDVKPEESAAETPKSDKTSLKKESAKNKTKETKTEDVKNEDAKAEDVKSEEAKSEEPKSEEAKTESAAGTAASGGLSDERPDYKAMASDVADAVSGGAKKVAGAVSGAVGKGNKALKEFSTKKGIPFKALVGGIAGIAALIVIIIIVVSVVSGNGYKKPLDNICEVFNDGETDVNNIAEAFLPGFAADAFNDAYAIIKKSDDFEDAEESIDEYIESIYDDLEDIYGDDISVTYEIKDSERLDDDDLEDITEALEAMYESSLEDILDDLDDMDNDDWEEVADNLSIKTSQAKKLGEILTDLIKEFKNPDVSDGYLLKVRIKVKGDDDKNDPDKIEVAVIKLNGDWMLAPNSYSDVFSEIYPSFSRLLSNLMMKFYY